MSLDQLGPYRIEAELGHGGMATVYRAYHVPLRRYVALKVLDTLLSRNAEFRERFDQEARIAAQLDHPNIVSIYDLGVTDDHQYIAMRLIEGPPLDQVIRDEGPMPAQRVLALAAEVADALAYAHEQGVFHRDVKPSNIMLRSNGRPILTDFGIARAVEGLHLTMSQSVVGTPRYMSPEQAQAQPVDGRSDIYSLGVVIYEMLGGRPPFTATSTPSLLYMHVHEAPPPLSQVRPDLSSGVRELVERCLAKSPDERFQSASQVVASCRALLTIPGLDAPSRTILLPPNASSPPTPQPSPAPGYQPAIGTPVPSSSRAAPAPEARPPGVAAAPWTPQPVGIGAASSVRDAELTRGPAATPRPEERRLPIPLPVIGGLAALIVIVGLFLALGDRLPGRASQPQAAEAPTVAVPTRPAATAKPTAGGGQTAPVVAASGSPSPVSNPTPVVAAAPGAASTRLADAMAALGRRDWAAALEQTNAGLQAAPKDPGLAKAAVQANLGLAEQLWSQGSPDQALVHYLVVREQPLRSAASQAELREAQLAAPYIWADMIVNVDPVTATAEYDKAFQLDPGYKDVRSKLYNVNIALARQQLAQGNQQSAIRYLDAARKVDPGRPEADDLSRPLTPVPSQ